MNNNLLKTIQGNLTSADFHISSAEVLREKTAEFIFPILIKYLELENDTSRAPRDSTDLEPEMISISVNHVHVSWLNPYSDYTSTSIPTEYFEDGGAEKLHKDLMNKIEFQKRRTYEQENKAKEERRKQFEVLRKEFGNLS